MKQMTTNRLFGSEWLDLIQFHSHISRIEHLTRLNESCTMCCSFFFFISFPNYLRMWHANNINVFWRLFSITSTQTLSKYLGNLSERFIRASKRCYSMPFIIWEKRQTNKQTNEINSREKSELESFERQ